MRFQDFCEQELDIFEYESDPEFDDLPVVVVVDGVEREVIGVEDWMKEPDPNKRKVRIIIK